MCKLKCSQQLWYFNNCLHGCYYFCFLLLLIVVSKNLTISKFLCNSYEWLLNLNVPLAADPTRVVPTVETFSRALVTFVRSVVTAARLTVREAPETSLTLVTVLSEHIRQTHTLSGRSFTVVISRTDVVTVARWRIIIGWFQFLYKFLKTSLCSNIDVTF